MVLDVLEDRMSEKNGWRVFVQFWDRALFSFFTTTSVETLQYLDEAGWTTGNRVVGSTQPRRIAATNVARRVADEMNAQLGIEVTFGAEL